MVHLRSWRSIKGDEVGHNRGRRVPPPGGPDGFTISSFLTKPRIAIKVTYCRYPRVRHRPALAIEPPRYRLPAGRPSSPGSGTFEKRPAIRVVSLLDCISVR